VGEDIEEGLSYNSYAGRDCGFSIGVSAVLRGRIRVLAEVQNGPQLRELRLKQKNPIGGFVHRSGFSV